MYRILTPFFCLFFCCVLQGCDFGKREKELQQKAEELQQREQVLLLREATVRLREEELAERARTLDSTARDSMARDSAFVYNPSLIGNWAVQMTCTETTCPGSAVGDTKTEHWDLQYQDNRIIAKAIAGKDLVRVYSGMFTGNTLELEEARSATTAQPATRMVVRLQMVSNRAMEGQREIVREGDCRIVYSVQMEKQPQASP
jgi:hypothetical protein